MDCRRLTILDLLQQETVFGWKGEVDSSGHRNRKLKLKVGILLTSERGCSKFHSS